MESVCAVLAAMLGLLLPPFYINIFVGLLLFVWTEKHFSKIFLDFSEHLVYTATFFLIYNSLVNINRIVDNNFDWVPPVSIKVASSNIQ